MTGNQTDEWLKKETERWMLTEDPVDERERFQGLAFTANYGELVRRLDERVRGLIEEGANFKGH
jgi:hypothetical protein